MRGTRTVRDVSRERTELGEGFESEQRHHQRHRRQRHATARTYYWYASNVTQQTRAYVTSNQQLNTMNNYTYFVV